VDVFVVSQLEIVENIIKINWSKIAKGMLSVQKRKVELLEAERHRAESAHMCSMQESASAESECNQRCRRVKAENER
jgi:hypothetical protein